MKRNASIRIVVWTIVAMVLFAALMVGIGGFSFPNLNFFSAGASYTYDNADQYSAGGATVAASGIREIDVSWVSGEVNVTVYDGTEIRFSESSNKTLDEDDQLQYRVRDGKLTIQYTKPRRGLQIFNNTPSKTLELQIPSSMTLKKLSIDNVSSTVYVDAGHLYIDEVDLESVSGSVTLSNLNTAKLDMESVSGDIQAGGLVDVLDVETVSGTQTYSLPWLPYEADMDSISGNVIVYTTRETGFTVKLESVSGNLTSDIATDQVKRQMTYGDGSSKIDVETVSGNVAVNYDASLESALRAVQEEAPKDTGSAVPSATPTKEPIPSSRRGF